MTKDKIIEMARQAGLDLDLWNYTDAFETFAKLVAEKEREACATICEHLPLPEWPNKIRQPLAQAIRARGYEK